MLQLPHNWPSFSAGALAGIVLEQAAEGPRRDDLGAALVGSAIELTLATRWRKLRPRLLAAERSSPLPSPLVKACWDVAGMTYVFLPCVEDAALDVCLQLAAKGPGVQIIVPAHFDCLLRLALDSYLGRLRPVVYAVGDFLNVHVSHAAADAALEYEEAVKRVLERCNARIRRAGGGSGAGTGGGGGGDPSMLIELPWEKSALRG